MSEAGPSVKPIEKQGADIARKASNAAKEGLRSAEQVADRSFDTMSSKVDEVGDQAAPAFAQISDQAQKLLQQGRDMFDDASKLVRERVAGASDMAVGYTKDEPLKAMLIAAAAGALVMGLVTTFASSRD